MNDEPASDKLEPPQSHQRWKVVTWVFLVLVSVLWLVFSGLQRNGPDLTLYISFSMLIFLCTLEGCWAGLGKVWWRWPVLAVVAPLMGVVSGYDQGAYWEYVLFTLSIIGPVGATALVLRYWKGSLQQGDVESSRDGLQFGIKDILIWTTTAAIFVAIGQAVLKNSGGFTGGSGEWLMIIGLGLSISAVMVVDIWALLGATLSAMKLFILVVATASSLVVIYWLIDHDWAFTITTLAAQLMMLFFLFTLRRQGYRFVATV